MRLLVTDEDGDAAWFADPHRVAVTAMHVIDDDTWAVRVYVYARGEADRYTMASGLTHERAKALVARLSAALVTEAACVHLYAAGWL